MKIAVLGTPVLRGWVSSGGVGGARRSRLTSLLLVLDLLLALVEQEEFKSTFAIVVSLVQNERNPLAGVLFEPVLRSFQ